MLSPSFNGCLTHLFFVVVAEHVNLLCSPFPWGGASIQSLHALLLTWLSCKLPPGLAVAPESMVTWILVQRLWVTLYSSACSHSLSSLHDNSVSWQIPWTCPSHSSLPANPQTGEAHTVFIYSPVSTQALLLILWNLPHFPLLIPNPVSLFCYWAKRSDLAGYIPDNISQNWRICLLLEGRIKLQLKFFRPYWHRLNVLVQLYFF